ncbi:hypothetical protein ACWDZ6_20335 [Streptomyces sp. NPDC002926]
MSLVLGVKTLLEAIVWDDARTDDAEAPAGSGSGSTWASPAAAPRKLYGTGRDNLWALSADRHAVTELKTGYTTDTIVKMDLDQLGGDVRWDTEQHPGVTPVPVMVHPSRDLDERAIAVSGMRVITPEKLQALKQAVVAYAVALADGQGRGGDEQAVVAPWQRLHARLAEVVREVRSGPLARRVHHQVPPESRRPLPTAFPDRHTRSAGRLHPVQTGA